MDAQAQPAARHLKYWLPAIVWAILISLASTDTFSAGHTSRFILPALHWLFPYASGETLERLHYLIRKSAHFTEYFAFSFILLRAVREEHRGWQIRWAIAALVIAAGYSAFDEFHQWFVPSRTASPWDSLLDTTGAATAQFVLWLWFWFRGRNSVEELEEVTQADRE
jgi:VanZ family protein